MTYAQEIRELVARARQSFARLPAEEQHEIAEHIVTRALETTSRKIHLSVMYDHCGGRELPAFPYHWRYKNVVGVSFGRKDAAAAQAWALTALVAGYRIAVQWRGRGGGGFVPVLRGGKYRVENYRENRDGRR